MPIAEPTRSMSRGPIRATAWALALGTVLSAAVLLAAAPAAAQSTLSYQQGETVTLTVGSIPNGYVTYWTSDRDGQLATGSTLTTNRLSVGRHTISALIYWAQTSRLVWRGSAAVQIVGATPAPARPAPTTPPPAPANPSQSTTGLTAPSELASVSTFLLGCSDAYMVDDVYPAMLSVLAGVVDVLIYVDNQYVQYDLIDIFDDAGIPSSAYRFATAPLDSIWMRDYGPLFARRNGALEVVDLDYYPDRAYDDAVPQRVAQRLGMANKRLRLYWEGGNYTADGQGRVLATSKLLTANRSRSAAQVSQMVRDAFGAELTVLEYMLNDGGTRHLDMFAMMTGPRSLFVNRFPSGHQNQARMDRNAQTLAGLGYQVTRIDLADTAYSSYSNGVIVNDIALVPTYGRASSDRAALDGFRAAGYRAYGIDCSRLIGWAGAIHCITITVPR